MVHVFVWMFTCTMNAAKEDKCGMLWTICAALLVMWASGLHHRQTDPFFTCDGYCQSKYGLNAGIQDRLTREPERE